MSEPQQFRSSIPKLDDALGSHFRRGQLIVAAGLQGGGKTILAAQLSRQFSVDGLDVLYVSTEATLEELGKRNMAAICSIPYDRLMDSMKIVTVPGEGGVPIHLPDPGVYGETAVEKAHPVLRALGKRFVFAATKPSGYDPQPELDRILTGYKEERQKFPDVLIYDFLSYPRVKENELDTYKIREAVISAARLLKDRAVEHQFLTIAFCQADPNLAERKKIDPGAMFDLKAVWEHADAFVGISQRLKDEATDDLENGLYERIQHLNVTTKISSGSTLVAVERSFEFQRFDPCRWSPKRPAGELNELESRARAIEQASEFSGYILARRKKFFEIFDCGSPHAINLYAFLLLVARTSTSQAGMSFYSRQTLSNFLGLSSKQLRTATDFLDCLDFIHVPKTKIKTSLRYRIEDWAADQRPSTKGYFKLFRNLRDQNRADLMNDPEMFRVWLYLLADARSYPDEVSELEPGEVLFKPRQMAEKLTLKVAKLEDVVGRLVARGSVAQRGGHAAKLAVSNWRLYQSYVHHAHDGTPVIKEI